MGRLSLANPDNPIGGSRKTRPRGGSGRSFVGDNERRMDPFDLFLPRGPFGRALQEGMAFLLGGFRNSLPSVAEQNAANRCQLKARVAVFLRQ